jgi:hypothetical protein
MDEIRDSEEALTPPPESGEATPEPEPEQAQPTLSAEDVDSVAEQLSINTGQATSADTSEAEKLAILEAIVYITDEPLGLPQMPPPCASPSKP